ncbi:hypothetical protein [Tateyamaria sp. 1078]
MPALDIAASRARILAPAVQAQSMGYRDNDTGDLCRSAPAPIPTPMPEPLTVDRPSDFVDLDASPLELAGMATQQAAPVPSAPASAPAPAPAPQPAPSGTATLTPALMRRILYLATTPAGQEPAYGRCQANLDGHGLRYGLGRFTQASGDLGRLLKEMHAADAAAFATAFGPADDFPEADPQALLTVTNTLPAASGGVGADLPQLQPVSGKLVWSKEWVARFKAAAKVPAFQAVQFKITAQVYLLPILSLAHQLGLNSEKGLALVVERVIQMGADRALPALLAAISPLKSDAMRTAALAHVAPGKTIETFQKEQGLGDTPGLFGVETHARVLALLRADKGAPVQMPTPQIMVEQIADFFGRDSAQSGLVAPIAKNADLSLDGLDVSAPDMGAAT